MEVTTIIEIPQIFIPADIAFCIAKVIDNSKEFIRWIMANRAVLKSDPKIKKLGWSSSIEELILYWKRKKTKVVYRYAQDIHDGTFTKTMMAADSGKLVKIGKVLPCSEEEIKTLDPLIELFKKEYNSFLFNVYCLEDGNGQLNGRFYADISTTDMYLGKFKDSKIDGKIIRRMKINTEGCLYYVRLLEVPDDLSLIFYGGSFCPSKMKEVRMESIYKGNTYLSSSAYQFLSAYRFRRI